MRDDDDEALLPVGTDDTFADSPAVADEYFTIDGPAFDGDDLESFGLVFVVLEKLSKKNF